MLLQIVNQLSLSSYLTGPIYPLDPNISRMKPFKWSLMVSPRSAGGLEVLGPMTYWSAGSDGWTVSSIFAKRRKAWIYSVIQSIELWECEIQPCKRGCCYKRILDVKRQQRVLTGTHLHLRKNLSTHFSTHSLPSAIFFLICPDFPAKVHSIACFSHFYSLHAQWKRGLFRTLPRTKVGVCLQKVNLWLNPQAPNCWPLQPCCDSP